MLPIVETAADLFYRRLFELDPSLRALFPDDMTAQKRKLMQTLHFIVRSIDWPLAAWAETVDVEEDLVLVVLALGRRGSPAREVTRLMFADVNLDAGTVRILRGKGRVRGERPHGVHE